MTFATGWALAGLALLAPLVALHLRGRGRRPRDVPSLLLWRTLELDSSVARRRRLRLPPLPLLLALQALALVLLVLALARPAGSATTPGPARSVVVDDSFWMGASGRMAAARRAAAAELSAAPAHATVHIIAAGPEPRVIYDGPAHPAAHALAALRALAPSAGASDLHGALELAAADVSHAADRMLVIHAPEDVVPAIRARPGQTRERTAGAPVADAGIFGASASCGAGGSQPCQIHATLRNTGASAVRARYVAQVSGRPAASFTARIPARSAAPLTLDAQPGERVSLRLQSGDPVAGDDRAYVVVPGAADVPRSSTVTLVGQRANALPVARALAALPGVTLRLRTPDAYRAADARASDLVVLDGWMPPGGLPAAPAVALIDPPRMPGGHVGGAISQPAVSGTDGASPLLDGVDLSSLSVGASGARTVALPAWVTPVAWSPGGPLLAAGSDGRTRLVVMPIQIGASNLPQLSSFPVLIANILDWSLGWAPSAADAGASLSVNAIPGADTVTLADTRGGVAGPDEAGGGTSSRQPLRAHPAVLTASVPGLYTVVETGPGVAHRATFAVNVGDETAAGSEPIVVPAPSPGHAPGRRGTPLAPWFLAAALVVLALEWGYWRTSRRRAVLAA